ncbi:MAG: hypothetical protein Q9184_005586 [Pyrenodesmia sp. 2 TL-2023]
MSAQAPSLNIWEKQAEANAQSPTVPISRPLPDRGLQPHSCVICQRRKVKCDRNDPCSNCLKHRVECEYRAPAPPRRRKRQSPDPQLQAKMRRYEEILQEHGVKVDELNADRNLEKPSQATSPLTGPKSDSGVESRYGPDTPLSRVSVTQHKPKAPQSTPYVATTEEFKHLEELLEGSDDEGDRKAGPGVIQQAYDKVHADGSGLLFGFSVNDDLKRLHPAPINIFRLWQTYLNNVYPLSMTFHAPTVQQHILDASADLENVSESMEALMFAIYHAAIVALPAEECEAMFGLPQSIVVNKYMLATQQALNAAKLLKNLDITVLQALVILLVASRHSIDPRSLWIHCGTAVRLGQRIGLHRDGSSLGLPPFEVEMRRRLWWQIVVLDSRVAELSGAGTSIVTALFDTRLPSNVNDSNLNPEMGELPPSHIGTSDMTFCLARYEIIDFLKKSNTNFFFFDGAWAKPDGVSATLAEKDQAIDELDRRLEKKYLRHCDPQITLHFLTKMYARTAVYRMRLVAHHPRHRPDKGASMPTEEKDLLCRLSLNMIENDNITHRNKSTDKFSWFINTNFQFPAFIYLISELRHRTRGELADRGWQAICEGFQNRMPFIADRKQSPMFQATSALALKAWQAREMDAAAHNEPILEAPDWIVNLRNMFGEPPPRRKRNPKYPHAPADSASRAEGGGERPQHAHGVGYSDMASAPDPGMNPTEWSPMDWTYWDELIQNWAPQVSDGNEPFDFGQPFNLGVAQ